MNAEQTASLYSGAHVVETPTIPDPTPKQQFLGPQGTLHEVVETYEDEDGKWVKYRNLHNLQETAISFESWAKHKYSLKDPEWSS